MNKLIIAFMLMLCYVGNSCEGCEWIRHRGNVIVQPTPVVTPSYVWTYVQQNQVQYVPVVAYYPVVTSVNVPVMTPVVPVQYPVYVPYAPVWNPISYYRY